MSINFYTIDSTYLANLKEIDNKIPNTNYQTNNKFFCGIVLSIHGYNYFAPISSFNKRQPTNLPIYNNDRQIIATIRFCFMIPVETKYLTLKDINSVEDIKYRRLLSTELQFCRKNEEKIKKAALRVYNYGINPQHKQNKNCCNFKNLENFLKK